QEDDVRRPRPRGARAGRPAIAGDGRAGGRGRLVPRQRLRAAATRPPARGERLMSTLGERSEVAAVARQTLERGLEHLLSLQHADGYWWGELESNATITSEHLFLMSAFGIATDDDRRKVAAELLATQ